MIGIGAGCATPLGTVTAAADASKSLRLSRYTACPPLSVPRQRKRKNVAAGGDRHILQPTDHIRHRRGLPLLAGFDVPERLPGFCVDCGKAPACLSVEHQVTARRKHAGVIVFGWSHLWDLPNRLAGLNVKGA